MPVTYELDNSLNCPREWVDVQRPLFHRRRFQKKINQIVGTASDGQPILKLEWAADVMVFESGHWRRRYRCTSHFIDGMWIDVGVPRWIITQRMEPARYLAEWNRTRWQEDPSQTEWVKTKETWRLDSAPPDVAGAEWRIADDGSCLELWDKRTVVVDVLGEPPPNGWYTHCFTLTEHLDCCATYGGLGRCWGLYWEPDDRVLELVRQMKAERDADPELFSPHEPMSAQEFAAAGRQAKAWNEARDEQDKREIRDKARDLYKTHGRQVWTGDRANKAREYSIPAPSGYQQTKGGLYVPAA